MSSRARRASSSRRRVLLHPSHGAPEGTDGSQEDSPSSRPRKVPPHVAKPQVPPGDHSPPEPRKVRRVKNPRGKKTKATDRDEPPGLAPSGPVSHTLTASSHELFEGPTSSPPQQRSEEKDESVIPIATSEDREPARQAKGSAAMQAIAAPRPASAPSSYSTQMDQTVRNAPYSSGTAPSLNLRGDVTFMSPETPGVSRHNRLFGQDGAGSNSVNNQSGLSSSGEQAAAGPVVGGASFLMPPHPQFATPRYQAALSPHWYSPYGPVSEGKSLYQGPKDPGGGGAYSPYPAMVINRSITQSSDALAMPRSAIMEVKDAALGVSLFSHRAAKPGIHEWAKQLYDCQEFCAASDATMFMIAKSKVHVDSVRVVIPLMDGVASFGEFLSRLIQEFGGMCNPLEATARLASLEQHPSKSTQDYIEEVWQLLQEAGPGAETVAVLALTRATDGANVASIVAEVQTNGGGWPGFEECRTILERAAKKAALTRSITPAYRTASGTQQSNHQPGRTRPLRPDDSPNNSCSYNQRQWDRGPVWRQQHPDMQNTGMEPPWPAQ